MVTLIASKFGAALSELGCPPAFLLLVLTVGVLFLPETRGVDLNA